MSDDPETSSPPQPPRIAVIGAGPVGLSLALLMRARCPRWQVHLFDARPLSRDVSGDPRTLALSLGSVQLLQRLGAWRDDASAPILEVHVSQTPPSPLAPLADPCVWIRAQEQAVPRLGAVLGYGALVAPLQQAVVAQAEAARAEAGDEDPRTGLRLRFGTAVAGIAHAPAGDGVRVQWREAGTEPAAADGAPNEDAFDLAVVAEGGVFGEQARKALHRDYGQRAWVGTVELEGATPGRAIERFTQDGPLALLPLPSPPAGRRRAALVWCVPVGDDPVEPLDEAQRLALLAARLPAEAGRVAAFLGPLKAFPLGLNAETQLADRHLVRIGNAAQTLHPVAGQGLNLGLRDAWTLADALARLGPLPAPGDIASAVRRASWQRAPDRWALIATTDFLARSFTWRLPGAASARALGLAALQAMGPLKTAFAKQMMFGRR